MKRDKFKTRKGELTRYALACGYIQQFEHKGQRVTLDMEHSVLTVHAYDFNEHTRLSWENFETLAAARRVYRALVKASVTDTIRPPELTKQTYNSSTRHDLALEPRGY